MNLPDVTLQIEVDGNVERFTLLPCLAAKLVSGEFIEIRMGGYTSASGGIPVVEVMGVRR